MRGGLRRTYLVFLLLICFLSKGNSQTYHLGTNCGGGSAYNYSNYLMVDRGAFWQKRIAEDYSTSAGSRMWEFEDNGYYNTWRAPSTVPISILGHNQVIPPDPSTASAYWRYGASSGGDGARLLSTQSGNYYTFNISENGWANSYMAVLETAYNPKTIISINDSTGSYGSRIATVTMSSSPSSGENIFIRYTTNNYSSSTLIPITFSGNVGTASIPVPSTATFPVTQKYYAFTSPEVKTAIDAAVNLYGQVSNDMLTIELSAGKENTFSDPVVVTSSAGLFLMNTYPTLREAFDSINLGVNHRGEITIAIIGDVTDNATAVLNPGNVLPASYTSIGIRPGGGSARTITGNFDGPLINLNGADNVTIDGREGGTGSSKNLTITNTNTGTSASTIRFINDATNNVVKYCKIKGVTTDPAGGVVFFSTTTETSGNDGNAIANNDISGDGANRPVNAIFSSGTSGKLNSSDTIRNNDIFDFCNDTITSNGICLGANSTNWVVKNNSLFETVSLDPAAPATYTGIRIVNKGDNFQVTGNAIGGNAADCAGTWGKANSGNNAFYGIYLDVKQGKIQGNKIKNFSWANSGAANWTGIRAEKGVIYIGGDSVSERNTIGEITGLGHIIVTAGACDGTVYGIYSKGQDTIYVNNNSIGSITTATTNNVWGMNFSGICCLPDSGATNNMITKQIIIKSNIIGDPANQIVASSAATGCNQKVFGISVLESNYLRQTGIPGELLPDQNHDVTISNNVISSMTNSATNITTDYYSEINGIVTRGGRNIIRLNNISGLAISGGVLTENSASVVGINFSQFTPIHAEVSKNIISNLTNYHVSAETVVTGIYILSNSNSSSSPVEGNFITNLTNNSTNIYAEVQGINSPFFVFSSLSFYNNIIILNNNNSGASVSGIKLFLKSSTLYYNTILLSGSSAYSANSAALKIVNSADTLDISSNIFANSRSGSGNNYSIYLDDFSFDLNIDHNDYYSPNGTLGYLNGDVMTIADWRNTTAQDTNSVSRDPEFDSPGGPNPIDYTPGADSLHADSTLFVQTDYFDIVRCFPTMGAIDFETMPDTSGQIVGDTIVCPGETNLVYTIPEVPFAMIYNWTVPTGWTYIAGPGPLSITAIPGSGAVSGYITVTAVNGCGPGPVREIWVIVAPGPNTSPIYHN